MKISIIIPAYNEEDRIGKTLDRIMKYLNKKRIPNEIIVVDDGSKDRTREVTRKFKGIILTPKRRNRGKGYSVKEGVLMSKGDYVLFTDSDLSTPIEELDRFVEEIKEFDIVIGSRALKESSVKSSWYKILLGRIGNFFISLLAVKGIKDTQCGFKLFRKETAKKLFEKQKTDGFGFDFEILYLAQKFGFLIKETPVKWVNSKESKVKAIDYPKTLIELLKIKLNDVRRLYD